MIAVFLIVAAFQPKDFRVERSGIISAPPPKVFSQVNDLHRFQGWNPWGKIDPAMKTSFEGPPAGTGASYFWSGNSEVGEGRMTIVESRPSERVRMKLEFLKPFAATHTADFTLAPKGNGTTITWAMYGEKNYMAKIMCLVMSMDKMVGPDFERGLANLKALAEKDEAPKI